MLHRLVADADVLLENYRPGVAAAARRRLGDAVRAQPAADLRERLGLRADRAVRAAAGLRPDRPGAVRGHERHRRAGRRPGQVRHPDRRPLRGAVLRGRRSSRPWSRASAPAAGQRIDTSLFEGGAGAVDLGDRGAVGHRPTPQPLGSAHRLSAPYQALRTRDGYITVGANNQRLWERLCDAIGRPELVGGRAVRDERRTDGRPRGARGRAGVGARRARDRRLGRRAARGRRAVRADPRLPAGVRGPAHAGARDGGPDRSSGRGHGQRARDPGQAQRDARLGAAAGAAARRAHDEVLREAGFSDEEIAAL